MSEKTHEWLFTEAKWHQFWLPQSGLIGGLIFGAIVSACFIAIGALIVVLVAP